MSILLTITASAKQIVFGIPEYLTFSTNQPSTIFYTLNGDEPTPDSDIVEGDTIYLPTDKLSFTLKVFAKSATESTDIYEETYSQTAQLFTKRFSENDGISILPFGSEPVEYLSVNTLGEEAQETSIPFIDLELKASSRDRFENYDDGKTSIEFINFTLELLTQDLAYQQKVSTPNDNINFDPTAGLIIVDGFTEEAMKSQVVKIINRPYNTMNTRSSAYNENLQSQPPIFGNLVRYFVNNQTGKIVFYYHDSRECRWIESHQKLSEPVNMDFSSGLKNTYVFPWVEDPVMSRIN
jgi:hypothetical protein